ncbi:MAG: oligoendopeptidase F, partial [Clostridia bacterium]|nr:oligoendopeptidase F [Clostridia bacterium]
LGEDYLAVLKTAFTDGWIDVYPNLNKPSGAYSAGDVYDVHPYVLLNHTDNLDGAMTLAHELGHTMHSYYSNHTQPYPKADYSLFVAEVASTCNEMLLMQHLLKKHAADSKALAYLYNHLLEQFRTTVFRQTMFAEFERIAHRKAQEGEPLTCESLSSAYYQLNKNYYGRVCVVDELIAKEWMRIPHFYRSFYVYKYATGFSAAVYLAQRILTEGASAVADYRRFLSAGSSLPPIEALKLAGVDMASPEPVKAALKIFGETVSKLEQLL